MALAAKAGLISVAEVVNFAAGIVVGKIGTAMISLCELEKYNKGLL
jgi:bifunctional ADP-heptose synthase (sugar kinase/adenylyltransferase)